MSLITININHAYPELDLMNQNIQNLIEETAALKGTVNSAASLLGNLAAQIEELKNDPAALQTLADDIRASRTQLADAVDANDGDPNTPPPTANPDAG